MSSRWRRLRLIPLGAGAAAMAAGLWGGFGRIGWELPAGAMPEWHGALMISGFLGTLISLERAVALGKTWAYAAPVAAAVGALALIAGAPIWGGAALLTASLALSLASLRLIVRMPALFTVLLAVAAAAWMIGNAAWLVGQPAAEVAGWWLTFLILTIAAERLELSRVLEPPRRSQAVFAVAAALTLTGAARGELAATAALGAAPLFGAGLLVMTGWLLRYDIARRTVFQKASVRFSACCMLAGYGWLGVAGVLLLWPAGAGAFGYDAVVHAIAIGFVLSMVFGHAPIILPAVTGARLGYSAAAYGPLALLHGSLVVRIAGDVWALSDVRKASAVLTVLALASYAAVLFAASSGRSARPRERPAE